MSKVDLSATKEKIRKYNFSGEEVFKTVNGINLDKECYNLIEKKCSECGLTIQQVTRILLLEWAEKIAYNNKL